MAAASGWRQADLRDRERYSWAGAAPAPCSSAAGAHRRAVVIAYREAEGPALTAVPLALWLSLQAHRRHQRSQRIRTTPCWA